MKRIRRVLSGRDPSIPAAPIVDWAEVTGSRVVSVCHPDWRGVRTAARSFGVPVIEVEHGAAAPGLVNHLVQAGVETLVVQGFPPGADVLLVEARAAGLATRCVLHSSMTQHGAEASEAAVADLVIDLQRRGVIERVGFVKEGLAEAFSALGITADYVPNRIPRLPAFERADLDRDRLHVGVFAEPFWRKNVVTQLGAVALLPAARAHVMRKPDVEYLAGLDIEEHGELAWGAFIALQGSMNLNLYVTLSECQPLTPLESYRSGVPCLFSRTSSLFRDDEYLWRMSTVDEVDNPRAIAGAVKPLLDEADAVVEKAHDWMERFDSFAESRWEEFTQE